MRLQSLRNCLFSGPLLGALWMGMQVDAAPPAGSAPGVSQQASSQGETEAPVRVARADAPNTPALADKLRQLSQSQEGFRPLLGEGDTAGWRTLDGRIDCWEFRDGTVSCIKPGGGWLQTEEVYSDFVLRFEFRLTAGANTGVAFRCLPQGNPSLTGYEVQLLDDSAAKYANLRPEQRTGSLYYAKAPMKNASLRPVGQWNQAEIICYGNVARVAINGSLVNEVHLDQLKAPERPPDNASGKEAAVIEKPWAGHLALQSYTSRVDFRNVRIRDLAQATPTGLRMVDLTDGEGPPADANAVVTIHFAGQLLDGKRLTNSYLAGAPVTASLETVISGWQEGISGMRVGGRRRLIIPPQLAYGEEGVEDLVPPHATLVFDVELLGIER